MAPPGLTSKYPHLAGAAPRDHIASSYLGLFRVLGKGVRSSGKEVPPAVLSGGMGIPKPWASDRLPSVPEIPTVTPPPATWGWGRDLGSVAVGLGTPTRPLPESDSSPGCMVPPQYARPSLTLGSLPARTQYL